MVQHLFSQENRCEKVIMVVWTHQTLCSEIWSSCWGRETLLVWWWRAEGQDPEPDSAAAVPDDQSPHRADAPAVTKQEKSLKSTQYKVKSTFYMSSQTSLLPYLLFSWLVRHHWHTRYSCTQSWVKKKNGLNSTRPFNWTAVLVPVYIPRVYWDKLLTEVLSSYWLKFVPYRENVQDILPLLTFSVGDRQTILCGHRSLYSGYKIGILLEQSCSLEML